MTQARNRLKQLIAGRLRENFQQLAAFYAREKKDVTDIVVIDRRWLWAPLNEGGRPLRMELACEALDELKRDYAGDENMIDRIDWELAVSNNSLRRFRAGSQGYRP